MADWTPDIETVLENIRLNSVTLSKQHKAKYFRLKYVLSFFRLPIIVISGINSIISVGFTDYISQKSISLTTCLLALICSIIGSIELYLSIQKQLDNELIISKDYYILAIDIFKTLSLRSEIRPIPSKEYLEKKYEEYIKLIENSSLLEFRITDALAPIPDKTELLSPNSSSSNLMISV